MTVSVDSALARLDPLMPDRARRWKRTLALTSGHSRTLVERQILSTYFHLLNGSSRFLLPPPPPSRPGEFALGTVLYKEEAGTFSITRSDLLHHVAIFGRSGAGKTNIAYLLMSQLISARIPFLFLDWKRTARDLLPQHKGKIALFTAGRSVSPLPFDLFLLPPGMEKSTFVQMAVDVIAQAYTLGDGAKNLLTKAIASAMDRVENPSSRSVLDHLTALPVSGRSAGWKTSAVRAMESIVFTQGTATQSWTKPEDKLLRMHTILELDAVTANYKQCLIPLLCLYLFHAHLSGPRERLRFVLFVEEAHHLLHHQRGKQESVMEMLLRQCRELGISVVILDQHPHLISPAVLGNTATTLLLNVKDPKDIATAGRLALLPESERHHLSQLALGTGVVKRQSGYRRPFLVRFDEYKLDKGAVDDQAVRALSGSFATLSTPIQPKRSVIGALAGSRVRDQELNEHHIVFLRDVITHPYDGVNTRYRRLKWSADKGNRVKRSLIAKNLLTEERVTINRTRRNLLRASPYIRSILTREPVEQRRESIVHEFWKHAYAEHYKSMGYTVQVEAPRDHGRADILAKKADESIVIEIETGKSDAVENVRLNLGSGVNRVVIVATDHSALARLDQLLTQAGFLPDDRIQLCVAQLHSSLRESSQVLTSAFSEHAGQPL